MSRLTGLPLRTITNQAQMVRTENLLLKAGRTLGYALPLGVLPEEVRWSSSVVPRDATAYQHWPWARKDLDADQCWTIDTGFAGHCSRDGQDGSAGLHTDPVVVLDFASLYPSCFIANNICFSTLLPEGAHDHPSSTIPHHRTPDTIAPNTRFAGIASPMQDLPDAIAKGENLVRMLTRDVARASRRARLVTCGAK